MLTPIFRKGERRCFQDSKNSSVLPHFHSNQTELKHKAKQNSKIRIRKSKIKQQAKKMKGNNRNQGGCEEDVPLGLGKKMGRNNSGERKEEKEGLGN